VSESGRPALDAVVVGAGPNGLAAALTLVQAGLSVRVYEAADEPGGGCRTGALTLPGFLHDVCSAVHPLAASSAFFSAFDPASHGVRLLQPEIAFAHPLEGGRAAAAYRSMDRTVTELRPGGASWLRTIGPYVRRVDAILPTALSPLRRVPPRAALGFLAAGALPASVFARRLRGPEARALFAGVAAHTMRPLSAPLTAGVGALLGVLAHTSGWPVVEGGSQRLTDALAKAVVSAGGTIETGRRIASMGELPRSRVTLFDLAPTQVAEIAGDALPSSYTRALRRFRHGPGVCKVDWALAGPVPWTADVCRQAGTVHVGGTFAQVASAEAEVAAGRHPEAPFVLVAQPSVVDPSRAPAGKHALWGYCHVPNGSDVDMTDRIEAQIERFAPGFRDLILARSVITAVGEQVRHPNYIGGDINGGAATLTQTLFRPTVRWNNYRTPVAGLYLCSASTPPGGGVHGMCGYYAARSALRHEFSGRLGSAVG